MAVKASTVLASADVTVADQRVMMTYRLAPLMAVVLLATVTGENVCFREYNAELDACSSRVHGQGHTQKCCTEGLSGYATELTKVSSKTTKKWFRCTVCPSLKSKPTYKSSFVDTGDHDETDPNAKEEEVQKKLLLYHTDGILPPINQGSEETEISPKSSTEVTDDMSNDLLDGVSRTRKTELKQSAAKWWASPVVRQGPKAMLDKTPTKGKKPTDDEWSQWSQWSSCSATCGGQGRRQRNRFCLMSVCLDGNDFEESLCVNSLPCPVDGAWSDWTNWTTCSSTCGEGLQIRSRQCNNPPPRQGGRPCEGLELESAPCIIRTDCPVNGQWSDWSHVEPCSAKPCSKQRGERIRFRSCTNPHPSAGGMGCQGRSWIREHCYSEFCSEKVDGGWCEWSDWTTCDDKDEIELKTRERNCSCPSPVNGGNECPGERFEAKMYRTTVSTITTTTKRLQVTDKVERQMNRCRETDGSGDGSDNCDEEQDDAENSGGSEDGSAME